MSSLLLTQFSKKHKYFNKKTYYNLGTLSFKSDSKCYSAYLATNQLLITIWGFSDPYFRIACYILIKSLQLFGMFFQKLFANKWNLACRTTNIWLVISDTVLTFQTNAGNIIMTSSKLHIRAIHHTLSEIGTKRWFSYQGFAIKRNYKRQKSLVEANRKHGFDLKTLNSISNF